jgi:hypothetical protein
MGWRCGSNIRMSALQAQSHEFKLQFHKNKNKQTKKLIGKSFKEIKKSR